MSLVRFAVVFGGTLANAVAAIVYFRVGKPLFDMARNQHSGPMTTSVETLDTLVPLALLIIQLGLLLYLVYGPVRRERAVAQGRVRR